MWIFLASNAQKKISFLFSLVSFLILLFSGATALHRSDKAGIGKAWDGEKCHRTHTRDEKGFQCLFVRVNDAYVFLMAPCGMTPRLDSLVIV